LVKKNQKLNKQKKQTKKMKKSILTLFALALGFGAIAQVNTITQGANGTGNKVKMTQKGNTEDRITQNGANSTVLTFQKVATNNFGNTVNISQLGSTNTVETEQSGRDNSIILTETGNINKATITQVGGSNALTLNQPGSVNTFESLQNGNSNTLNMTANGNYETAYIAQDYSNGGLVSLTQDGTNDKAQIYQGASDANNFLYTTSINNTVNASQNGWGSNLPSSLSIYQWGESNSINVGQDGGHNILTITQSGARNTIKGPDNDAKGVQWGMNNTGILTQSGSDNTMKYGQINVNDTIVNGTQTGTGNTTNFTIGAY